jgi:uncharacterized protein
MKIWLSLVFLYLFAAVSCKNTAAELPLPEAYQFRNQMGYVNDFADLLTLEQENELEKVFSDFDLATTNELGVVTVTSIAPYTDISKFGDALLEDWRFGKDDRFNGLLITVYPEGRQVSIRFGAGIQKKLSDAEAQVFLDQILLPAFKKGKYDEGITGVADAIMKKLNTTD